MKVSLAFGKTGLIADIPDKNLVKVMTMQDAPPLPDPSATLREMLIHPLGSPALADMARGKATACVVISDITRPVPNSILLPPILETLERSGIRRGAITILVATGLHRASTPEETRQMVGETIMAQYRIVDHHARAMEEQEYLGETARGTPVYIDRIYCRAELRITTAFIEPHLMAGFSGGRKLVAPGCAGELTIKALHSPTFLEDPHCSEGILDGNPLHAELLEIARIAGHDFIVNVALDQSHRITGMFAGDPQEAHARGVAFVRSTVRCTLDAPADMVVTTSAGYPLDLTYYQAIKGMTAALPVVKEGGMLILVAECAEGLGSEEFTRMAISFPNAQNFIAGILEHPVVIDQWQLEECARAARKASVILVSPRIAREHRDSLFVRVAETLDEALREGFRKLGPGATVAVIPKGPYTLVELEAN